MKSRENRKEREYVLKNLTEYMKRIRQNDNLSFKCAEHKRKCSCESRKDVIYIDESYIHQNHVSRQGYYLPEDCDSIKKPSGKGARVVMAAGLSVDGWLGTEPHDPVDFKKYLSKVQKDNSHSYGSIKYWPAKTSTKDYHRNFNQEIFLDFFENNILHNLTAPSIIVMDNAPYHRYYDKDTFFPRKAKKKELREWLEANDIIFDEKALRAELIELAEANCEPPVNLIEQMADEHGRQNFGTAHEILYLPQYHPELNAIEWHGHKLRDKPHMLLHII